MTDFPPDIRKKLAKMESGLDQDWAGGTEWVRDNMEVAIYLFHAAKEKAPDDFVAAIALSPDPNYALQAVQCCVRVCLGEITQRLLRHELEEEGL